MTHAAEIELTVRSALARHPVAVDCARSAGEMLSTACDVVTFGSGRAFVVAASDIERVLQPRPLADAELDLIAGQGQHTVGERSSAFAINSRGHIVGALTVHTAVTEQQAAALTPLARVVASVLDDALSADHSFEASVLEGLRDAVVVFDPDDFTIRWVNRAIGSLLGRTPVEVVGMSATDLIHPDDLEDALDAVTGVREGREMYRLFVRIARGDGHYERVEITGVDHTENDVIGGIVMSVRSADRQNELERTIDRSSSMSAAVIRSLHDGIVSTNEFGDITTVNRAAREMFGIDPERDVTTIKLDDLQLLDSRGQQVEISPFPQAATERTSTHDLEKLSMVVAPQGVRYLAFDQAPVSNSDGDLVGSVLVFHDRTAERAAQAELRRQALHDQLTGLPNRRQLEQRIHELAGSDNESLTAAIFIDLDAFKLVNDTYGHRVGDDLIRIAASRLHDAVRPDDLLVRQGGDEFVVLLTNASSIHVATQLAERLRKVLAVPYHVGDHQFDITTSIGVAATPSSQLADGTVLQHADIALYAAKASGRDRVEVFDEALAEAVSIEEHQRRTLRSALNDDRVVMHFQPLVNAETGAVDGYEALARVRTEDGNLIGPSGFLDSLTSSGLIWDLDRTAFALSCQAAAALAELEPEAPPKIACNFSSFSLTQPNFVDFVIDTARTKGVEAEQICLEITESAAFDGGEAVLSSLRTLNRAGFHLALDDFGTGYSSLAHLRDLPISSVKVDRSFVSQLTSGSERAITQAVVTLAQDLGLEVVAEGVETTENLELVRELGFNTVQGWHYAAAMPLSEALAQRHSSIASSRG